MSFIDIAFQAEVSRYEDPDFEEFAHRKCNEDPKTRGKAIEELRRMIYDRGECNPRRLDDAYLLRFLRCRRFIPAKAHRLIVRYEEFRRKNAHLYDCDAFNLERVKGFGRSTFPDSPENGRVTIFKFDKWDPNEVSIEEGLRCALLVDEICAMQPKLQILGVTILLDLEGVSLSQARHMTPGLASQIVAILGMSFPLTINGFHVINNNWIFNSFVYIFKQFVPSTSWNLIHFHGYDLTSLHKHIDPRYLPREYGGTCKYVFTSEEWISKINKYKDDFLVRELRDLGFTVRD